MEEPRSTTQSDLSSDEEVDFGIKLPSYISALKNILLQYPENGQILKEILQNAEDAKATKVKFLVDMNRYGTTPGTLLHQDLAQFQGPALYAYNNAIFTEDDWEGLQRIQESIKEKDPMSIGRFGLGFKSIYHITDFPGVLSDKYLAFFDPFERYFHNSDGSRGTGKCLNFVEKPKTIRKYQHQFEPFLNKFGFEKSGVIEPFGGTIFRLPLRQIGTRLSESVHTEDSMKHLYDSFIRDAHISLLFLHSVEEVEFLWQEQGQQTPSVYYKVQVSAKDRQDAIINGRCRIVEQCQNFTFPLQVTVTDRKKGHRSETSHWMISEVVDKKTDDDDRRQLAIPVVGVAAPLDDIQDFIGRIFCYLPLSVPEVGDLVTGLPCHVHGTFSLTPDRHHILAPTVGESWEGNSDLIWNHMLIKELYPKAYRHLLLGLVKTCRTWARYERTSEVVMNALADLTRVKVHWQDATSKVLKDVVMNEEVLYSSSQQGCWLRAPQAILEDTSLPPATQKLLLDIALQCHLKIVQVPQHVHGFLIEFVSVMQKLSAELISNVLRSHILVVQQMSREDKLQMVMYLLGDSKNVVNLEGLPLIPLKDGTFTVFSSTTKTNVYIAGRDQPIHLLRGKENPILDPNLSSSILLPLGHLADRGRYQLKRLACADIVCMLRDCIPNGWKNTSFSKLQLSADDPNVKWLYEVWEYLESQPSVNCSQFIGLLFLPDKTDRQHVTVYRLQNQPRLVLRSYRRRCLSDDVCKALQQLGLDMIVNCSASILRSVDAFICKPEPLDVLNALCQNTGNVNERKFSSGSSAACRHALLSFISESSEYLSASHKGFLMRLPIFQCEGDKSNFVCIQSIGIACSEKPAIDVHVKLLDLASASSRKLAIALGAKVMTSAGYLQEYVFKSFMRLNKSQVDVLVNFLYSHWSSLKRQDINIINQAQVLNLVCTKGGKYTCPKNLFNPLDTFLIQLFDEEDVFPHVPHCVVNVETYIAFLKDLGLKCKNDITGENLVDSACRIESLRGNGQKQNMMEKKAAGILEVVKLRPQLISERLKKTKWLPVKERPKNYPKSLKWRGTEEWVSPVDIEWSDVNNEGAFLVGTIHPLCKYELPSLLMRGFEANTVTSVVSHLSIIAQSYSPSEKALYLPMVLTIYRYLEELSINEVTSLISSKCVFWHGNGFAHLHEMCVIPPEIDIFPYQYPLPPELRQVEGFLRQLGVKQVCDLHVLITILQRIRKQWQELDPKLEPPQDDIEIVRRILDFLARQADQLDEESRINIPVPVLRDGDVTMVSVGEATYAPSLIDSGEDDQTYNFLHSSIPHQTADALGIPKLNTRIIGGEEVEFDDFGQSESLTDRLKSILQGYQDGYSVPKELIQNADDAGATVVRFMWDERKNAEHRKSLFSAEMADCHGPAFWAYNNAQFTADDYHNIARLGSGNKARSFNKIGKFGLGFNSCYNLTDIPSFVSSGKLVILDPNLIYMHDHIYNKSKPGKIINFVKNKSVTKKYSDQFRPYQDVFGCNILGNETYPGTLFRFPLRDKVAAGKSEVTSLVYDRSHMIGLLEKLCENAAELLLFTQNVHTVELYHLCHDAKSPEERVRVVEVRKAPEKVISSEGFNRKQAGCKVLSEAASAFHGQRKNVITKMSKTEVVKLETHIEDMEVLKMDQSVITSKQYWLISHWLGQQESREKAHGMLHMGLTPLASVAIPVNQSEHGYCPVKFTDINKVGKIYCYLPLPQESGLPVHINGSFAVHSDRRGLSERSSDAMQNFEADWNEILMKDAVAEAYLKLLCALDEIVKTTSSETPYWPFWPFTCATPVSVVMPLVTSMCEKMAKTKNIPVLHTQSQTLFLDDTQFFDRGQLIKSGVKEQLEIALAACPDEILCVPNTIEKCFHLAKMGRFISSKYLTMQSIFTKIILLHIDCIPAAVRNILIMFAIKLNDDNVNEVLSRTSCIPTNTEVPILRKPVELVDPDSHIGDLFSVDEGRFPSYDFKSLTQSLTSLGMQNQLTWDAILERAESIKIMHPVNMAEGQARYAKLIQYIASKLNRFHDCPSDIKAELTALEFIPSLPQPGHHPLPWKWKDSGGKPVLISAASGYQCKELTLVSASCPLISSTSLPMPVRQLLSLTAKSVPLNIVITQLQTLIEADVTADTAKIAKDVYIYLGRECRSLDSIELMKTELADRPFIFVHEKFYFSHQVGTYRTPECPPYIQKLPADYVYNTDIMQFFSSMGYTGDLDVGYIMKSLQAFAESKEGSILHSNERLQVINMLKLLGDSMKGNEIPHQLVIEKHGYIPVPDAEGKLKPSTELCLQDAAWISQEKQSEVNQSLVNPDMSVSLAQLLGVKTQRAAYFMKNPNVRSFGQSEDLVVRLKHIVDSYPFGIDILKEFIQNADDAGASQIHFVLDTRDHPHERVFCDPWKKLQGPALLVFNDRPFAETDYEGIKKLGVGSKLSDPNKIGRFGIGFSSAYHITDVPCFLSKSPEFDRFCCLDPHCYYTPTGEWGLCMDNLDSHRTTFPDVFNAFPDHLPRENATVFRFPLRTKQMASLSKVKEVNTTCDDIEVLFKRLIENTPENMLFLNHVQEVQVSRIGANGKLTELYHCHAKSPQDGDKQRRAFRTSSSSALQPIRSGRSVQPLTAKQTSYHLFIHENHKKKPAQEWLVVQQFSCKNNKHLTSALNSMAKPQRDSMKPQAGTAVCLRNLRTGGVQFAGSFSGTVGKFFCGLSTDESTGLPIHINGYFSMMFENRRELRKQDAWNEFLFTDIVAPCYVRLIELLCQNLSERFSGMAVRQYTKLVDLIDVYFSKWPDVSNPMLTSMARSFYAAVVSQKNCLLPVVRKRDSERKQEHATKKSAANRTSSPHVGDDREWNIYWVAHSDGACRAYLFDCDQLNPSSEQTTVQQLLCDLGLDIVFTTHKSAAVAKHFESINVPIPLLSRQEVVKFLCSGSDHFPRCNLKVQLPAPVWKTPIKNVENCMLLLKFCMPAEAKIGDIIGLPLLMTWDNKLHVFKSKNEDIINFKWYWLFPKQKATFLDPKCSQMVGAVKKSEGASSFRNFWGALTISKFAEFLKESLPQVLTTNDIVELTHDLDKLRLYEIWSAIEWLLHENKETDMACNLTLLSNLSLLPVTCKGKPMLYPIGRSHVVSDQATAEILPLFKPFRHSVPTLRLMKRGQTLPELQPKLLENIVASAKKPASILNVLHHCFVTQKSDSMSDSCAESILDYIVEHLEMMRSEGCKDLLKAMPLYQAAKGSRGPLSALNYVVAEVPVYGLEYWQGAGNTMLWEKCKMKPLYVFLECKFISVSELYTNFILPILEKLPLAQMMRHLYFVYEKIESSAAEFFTMPNILRDSKFVYTSNKELHHAHEYCDPDVEAFTLFEQHKLPPKYDSTIELIFPQNQWLVLLRKCGMKTECSSEDFVRYSCEVRDQPMKSSTELKAKFLIGEIFVHHESHSLRNTDAAALLTNCLKRVPALAASHCKKILDHIMKHLSFFASNDESKLLLRALPLYMAKYGERVAMAPATYVVPSVPRDGIDVWNRSYHILFLEDNSTYKNLYKSLGCEFLSVSEFYNTFMLKHLEYFTQEQRMIHLHFIWERSQESQSPSLSLKAKTGDQEFREMLNGLKSLDFVEGSDGELHPANEFCDPTNPVFAAMEPHNVPPPFSSSITKHFREYDWLEFLRKCGMRVQCTSEDVLRYAKQIEEEGRRGGSSATRKKSQVLIEYIASEYENDCLSDSLLSSLKDIQFVCPSSYRGGLDVYHKPLTYVEDGKQAFVAFHGSLDKEYKVVVWSHAPVIDFGKMRGEKFSRLRQHLGVLEKPSTDIVVSHLKNLSGGWYADMSSPDAAQSEDVFREIIEYLESHESDLSDSQWGELKQLAFIPVEGGRRLVPPGYTVMNLQQNLEIPPFLYSLPGVFYRQEAFLVKLGVTKEPSFAQYVSVLSSLHHRATGHGSEQPLLLDELHWAQKAMKGFFEQLSTCENFEVTQLYLLSESRKLMPASKLMVNDVPEFYSRIPHGNFQFLDDSSCDCLTLLQMITSLNNLPLSIVPRFLSHEVSEEIANVTIKAVCPSPVSEKLMLLFSSPELSDGIIRVFRHAQIQKGQPLDEERIQTNVRNLGLTKFSAVPEHQLFTQLRTEKKTIKGAKIEKNIFAEFNHVGKYWHIYIQNCEELGIDELIYIAEVIGQPIDQNRRKLTNVVAGGQMNKANMIIPLLKCQPCEVQHKLDRMNITRLKDSTGKQSAHIQSKACFIVPNFGKSVPEEYIQNLRPVMRSDYLHVKQCVAVSDKAGGFLFAMVQKFCPASNNDVHILTDTEIVVSKGLVHMFSRM